MGRQPAPGSGVSREASVTGRLFGFEVAVHPSFFLMAVVLGWPRGSGTEALLQAASWVVVVTVSVLFHELGHAWATRAFGATARIELYSMGGLTYRQPGAAFTPWQDAAISFAGPAAGFILGGFVYAGSALLQLGDSPALVEFVRQMIWVNLGWGALNLLPMRPLDGGNILRTGLNALTGGRGERPSAWLSIGVAAIGVATALHLGWTWAAFIAGWAAITTYQELRHAAEREHDEPLWADLQDLVARWRELEPHARLRRFETLLASARSQELRTAVGLRLAWQCVQAEDGAGAAAALVGVPHTDVPELLTGLLAALQGKAWQAISILQTVVDAGPASEPRWPLALMWLARAHVQVENPDRAVAVIRAHRHDVEEPWVLGAVMGELFHSGHFEQAAALGADMFERFGDPNDAYNVACSLARQGHHDDAALDWLSRAVDAGYRDPAHLDADPDLEPLRRHPAYAALRARLE